ncbi:ROK family protein [Herbiconiux solani]|uniref:ROK family protein n=1 Tax=Herbiconiux solani TaxID=661329 RepID=UPI0012EEBA69
MSEVAPPLGTSWSTPTTAWNASRFCPTGRRRSPSSRACRGPFSKDSRDTPCFCGRRGCLGRATDPYLLVEDAVDLGILPESARRPTSDEAHAWLTELRRLADEGVPEAAELLARAADAIAEATRVLVSAYDASLVVFGGPFWNTLADLYIDVIRKHLATTPEGLPSHPRIESTVMGDAVGAVGAASLVFDQSFSTRLSAYELTS